MNLLVIPALPLAAALLSLLPTGRRLAPGITLLAALAAFLQAILAALRVVEAERVATIPGWVELDGFGGLLLLLIAFVGVMAALFSWGYLARHGESAGRVRFYCVHFNLFLFALMLVPVLEEPALAWIAIEFTAVFSVLLVAFDNTREALEAAWKYIALMFMGAAIALLGFFLLFSAQAAAGGGNYTWAGLRAAAPAMPPALTMAAFLMILVGFGVKVGFVPMHTWLPDAHSQAPAPVCALLSGVKTTAALYCILRLVPLLPSAAAATLLEAVGLVSVGVAAFLLLQVRDYKRLFAYSTVEHMGIIFVAAGLGGSGGARGAMLQMVGHSLTKSFCFFAAGAALLVVGTREIASTRGLIRTSPPVGAALLFGALAIGGAPPFALFLSEFSIFWSGMVQGEYLVVALLVCFIAAAFFGVLLHVNNMVFGQAPADAPGTRFHGSLPLTCTLTLVLAAVPILLLGVYQPAALHALTSLAASALLPVVAP